MFDRLITTALENAAEAASLRPVVEKEILHHDILREMSTSGLLGVLTFMGGTYLRACYGSPRLSGDLDFSTAIAERELPSVLRNPYRIDMGTSGLIVPAESLREILVDKLIAFALRPNRLKNRDVWDILWLFQHDVPFSRDLLELKLSDRGVSTGDFAAAYAARCTELRDGRDGYVAEIRRFLAPTAVAALDQPGYWQYATRTIESIDRSFGV